MATTYTYGSGDYVRPYKGGRIQHFPEAATQTFKRGAVLIAGGAGVENQCKIAADNPVANILGIAAADASGTTGTKIPVWLACEGAEFIGRTLSTDANDFSDIGTARALLIDATNVIWVVDTSDAGHDAVVVVQLINPVTKTVLTAEGDFGTLAVFKFIPSVTIWQGLT
jgi:hypothetical protein